MTWLLQQSMRVSLGVVACALAATVVHAAPLVDGTLVGDEAFYGAPLFIQTITTQFGDSTDPSPMTSAGGSEIDALYATVQNGRLYMLITGNLENNFNKLDLFLDTKPGGYQELPYDDGGGTSEFGNEYPEVEPFITGGVDGVGALQKMEGILFDDGFEPDYFASFTNGTEGDVDRWAFNVQFSEIAKLQSAGGTLPDYPTPVWGTAGGSFDAQVSGGILVDKNTANVGADADEQFFIDRGTDNSVMQIRATIDNSNIAGVAGSGTGEAADQEAAAAVTTGIEWSIPLSQIGNPTGQLLIGGFINNGSHDYLSNQVIGGLPVGSTNLMNVSNGIDFTTYEGEQFVLLEFDSTLIGDFNFNGVLDGPDIDDLTFQSASGNNSPVYDLTDDGLVNSDDVTYWAHDLFNTWIGDADLDGEFKSEDLIQVLAASTYEKDVDAVWSSGDFNGDGRFSTEDLIDALGDSGYENGVRPGVAAVPEPASVVMLALALVCSVGRIRRR